MGKTALENKLFDYDSNDIRIKFSIAEGEIVNLSLFNQDGEKISNLLNEELDSGIYAVKVNFEKLQKGKYFYKLTTPLFSDMKSFIKAQ